MSTATAEPVASEGIEGIVQQPTRTVLFLAKRSELRLVKEGRYPIVIPHTGQRIGETRGVVVPFLDSRFECPMHGDVTIMDPAGAGEATIPAHDTKDEKGRTIPGLLSWMENHPRCGDPNEGFIKIEPTAPPVSKQEHEGIVEAATNGDVGALEVFIKVEREGWGREEIISVAEGAKERILAMEARVREDERAAVEREQHAADQIEERVKAAEKRAAAAEKALADATAKPKAK